MMASRKRSFSSFNDMEKGDDMPPPKRMKFESRGTKTMFSDIRDHKECIGYLQSIESSELSQTLAIPFDINREIAEYATGTIHQCGNKKCNSDICVLNETLAEFVNGKETEWNYCSVQHVYFCALCKPSTIKFVCCDTVQHVTEERECYCNTEDDALCLNPEEHSESLMGYKCNFCDDNSGTCDECGRWMCEHHREFEICDMMKHKGCCTLLGDCRKCGRLFCKQCDGGSMCDTCYDEHCPDCLDGHTCQDCGNYECKDLWTVENGRIAHFAQSFLESSNAVTTRRNPLSDFFRLSIP